MHRLSDYAFELPEAQIAQVPADRRDASRLLELTGEGPRDGIFADLPERLPEGSLLVVNDTKVLAARLSAVKATGGVVELLLVEPTGAGDHEWRCIARASKAIRSGAVLDIRRGDDSVAQAEVIQPRDARGHVVVRLSHPATQVCEQAGDMPLPPYIARQAGATPADRERYQTVYARTPGAIAAPTAGLHFTDAIFARLAERGIEVARLTLHVGPGTFAPVRVDELDQHRLHEERYEIPDVTAEAIARASSVVAVGTTSVRALEAAAVDRRRVEAGAGRTELFIRPGFRFRVVDHLITNFHLPESTLLMLVCAFAGYQRVMAGYRHAVAQGYRFYSYGDAMLVHREELG